MVLLLKLVVKNMFPNDILAGRIPIALNPTIMRKFLVVRVIWIFWIRMFIRISLVVTKSIPTIHVRFKPYIFRIWFFRIFLGHSVSLVWGVEGIAFVRWSPKAEIS